jgi:hypothetical protein
MIDCSEGEPMFRHGPGALRRLGALLLVLAAVGCASPAERVQGREDLLAAARFTIVPANTPQRVTSLATLPPHRIVREERHGKVVFLYADPSVCACLYIGQQTAFDRYEVELFERKLVTQQETAAEMNSMNWNWGPWGPGWWYQ